MTNSLTKHKEPSRIRYLRNIAHQTSLNNARGQILLVTLLLLANFAMLLSEVTNSSSRQSHVMANYQQHIQAFIKAESCLKKVTRNLRSFPDANSWSKTNESSLGLYHRKGQTVLNVKMLSWTNKISRTITEDCRYIVEYLTTIHSNNPSIRGRHIVRISIRLKSKFEATILLQSVAEIENKSTGKAILFLNPVKLQQWTQL